MNLDRVRVELPQAAPLKKVLEALKQFLTAKINFCISDEGLLIEDKNKDNNIIINACFSRKNIKMYNTAAVEDKKFLFNIESCNITEFIKPINAKESISLIYKEKVDKQILKYTCGGKASSIYVGPNSYYGTSSKIENDDVISTMKDMVKDPTCIVDARTFKDTLKDFKSCTGDVEIFAQKNGIKFQSKSQRGQYSSTFGKFDDSKQYDEEFSYVVSVCTGKQLHSIHKTASSSKFVRIYTIRNNVIDEDGEKDEFIYPLLFESSLDDFGTMQIYIKYVKE